MSEVIIFRSSKAREQEIFQRALAWEHFRPCVSIPSLGYYRVIDDQKGELVVHFAMAMPRMIAPQLYNAGFSLQTEYCGLRRVWRRENDFVGRQELEAIEAQLRATRAVPLASPEENASVGNTGGLTILYWRDAQQEKKTLTLLFKQYLLNRIAGWNKVIRRFYVKMNCP